MNSPCSRTSSTLRLQPSPCWSCCSASRGNSFYKAALLYGRILLDEDNDRGLDYLMQAARGDINLVEECARIGGNYQFRKHGEEIAKNWWEDMMRILERQTGEAS